MHPADRFQGLCDARHPPSLLEELQCVVIVACPATSHLHSYYEYENRAAGILQISISQSLIRASCNIRTDHNQQQHRFGRSFSWPLPRLPLEFQNVWDGGFDLRMVARVSDPSAINLPVIGGDAEAVASGPHRGKLLHQMYHC